MPSPSTDVLTWGMGLAVILQVIQAPAHYLHSHLILPRPHGQPQLRLQDATCPGPNRPAAIYSHSQAQHCPTMLIGKGWRVTPAPCRSLTSWSQSLPAWPCVITAMPTPKGAHQRNPHGLDTQLSPTAQVLAAPLAPWRQSAGLSSQPGGSGSDRPPHSGGQLAPIRLACQEERKIAAWRLELGADRPG